MATNVPAGEGAAVPARRDTARVSRESRNVTRLKRDPRRNRPEYTPDEAILRRPLITLFGPSHDDARRRLARVPHRRRYARVRGVEDPLASGHLAHQGRGAERRLARRRERRAVQW